MTVDVDSLEDLVDVAIDADRRVIEDTATSTYVVFDGDVTYQFVPERAGPPEEEPAAGDGSASGRAE